MKVRVLGCSGAIARDCRTTSFLIDHDLLVDAGTGVGDLLLEEMQAIDHVLLTHSHLDHLAALPLMLDAVAGGRRSPLRVHGLPGTLAALRAHVFNDVIWPDFTRIPSPDQPFVTFHELEIGQVIQLGARRVEVLPAVHGVPACAYAIREQGAYWVYSGDTERNPEFWRRFNQLQTGMLVIETAFSRREQELAVRSQHLAPDSLMAELARMDPQQVCPVYIMHTKPAEATLIMSEIRELDEARPVEQRERQPIRWLQAGQEFLL